MQLPAVVACEFSPLCFPSVLTIAVFSARGATAQHSSLPLSQSTAAAVAGELQKRQIPVRALAAPLRPLNNVSGAAIAVEVAPQGSDVSQLTAPDYQQLVTSAVATAIAATRDQLGGAQ